MKFLLLYYNVGESNTIEMKKYHFKIVQNTKVNHFFPRHFRLKITP
jgi:hypothetical protein